MRIIVLFFLLLYFIPAQAQRKCGSIDRLEQLINEDSNVQKKIDEVDELVRNYIERKDLSKGGLDQEYIIPIVFQVVYHPNKPEQNISEKKIFEQIEILNKDFNGLNSDLINVPDAFKSSIGHLNVRFVLANRDPNGQYTNGIVRTETTKSTPFKLALDDVKKPASGGVLAWDTKKYLNIWVCNLENSYLGYSSFAHEAGKPRDGFVVGYKYVGYTDHKNFNLGRTSTHELAHYFNLRHIWGDADNCIADDGISDTPLQYTYSSGNPSFPKFDQCTPRYPGIMFMNFLDYSHDSSLLMFTKEQVVKMEAAIHLYRTSLLNSDGYQEKPIVDLSMLKIDSPSDILCEASFSPAVSLMVKGTKDISDFKVALSINGVEKERISWTGNITKNDVVKVDFSAVYLDVGAHDLTFYLTQVNGQQQDDNPTNDTLSMNFINVSQQNLQLPYHERLESIDLSENNVFIKNPDQEYTWERSPQGVAIEGEYSYFINNYNYLSGEIPKDDIILPSFNLNSLDQATLSFYVAAAQFNPFIFPNDWDTLQVLVSLDCGQSFDIIYNKGGEDLVTVPDAVPEFFVPDKNQWRKEIVDLSNYVGLENVRIIIRNISNYENNIYIDDLKVEGSNATSIRTKMSNENWILYPNPTTGQVTLDIRDLGVNVQQIDWINTLGQRILSKSFNETYSANQFNFDLSSFPEGIYIVNMLLEDGATLTKKLLLK